MNGAPGSLVPGVCVRVTAINHGRDQQCRDQKPGSCPAGHVPRRDVGGGAGLQIHGARRDAHHPCWERDLGLPLARELQTLGSTASEDHLEVCDNTGFPSPTDSPPLGGGARGFPKSGVISQEACQAQSHFSGPWPVDRMTGPGVPPAPDTAPLPWASGEKGTGEGLAKSRPRVTS